MEDLIRQQLLAIGEDPDREGLKNPTRGQSAALHDQGLQ